MLFTDIVSSTERAAALGDHAWRQLLDTHHAIVRAHLARYRGREIDTAGDGFLASFDGPARAVRCGQAVVAALRDIGLDVRAGVHTGECQLADGKLRGIAVHIGSRVASQAAAGEVLVTRTVRDLVAGSGLDFENRGERYLKGIHDPIHLFAAALSSSSEAPVWPSGGNRRGTVIGAGAQWSCEPMAVESWVDTESCDAPSRVFGRAGGGAVSLEVRWIHAGGCRGSWWTGWVRLWRVSRSARTGI